MSFPQFSYDPFVEFNRLLDEALDVRNLSMRQRQRQGRRQIGSYERASSSWPTMDVHENEKTNLVEASFELPGVRKEDVSIDVHNRRLTVSGETKLSTERDEAGYAVRERRYGKFSRTLQLPADINSDEIKASMENGILTVTFPRTARKEEGPKKITVA